MVKKKKKECPNGLTMGENLLCVFISGIFTFAAVFGIVKFVEWVL